MRFFLPLSDRPKTLKGPLPLGGVGPDGTRLGVNNYYFEENGTPRHHVAGELHYSRVDEAFWEAEVAKMKAGGIDLVSTYVFWNHHEEVEGVFRWDGRRNLRWFLELVAAHGLKAIVRLGPFCHGEVRNGGVPDWVYGQPWEARTDDPGYLVCVRRLYSAIAGQLEGLFFQDGGPVIALQLENEFQHSAAPWEMTTATSKEWLPGGRGGADHLRLLKRIAQDCGMNPPFWTATAWGHAAVPLPEALPLWGGYAYQPWLFYGDTREHPVTPEFLFRDHHNNQRPRTYNFEPDYAPEDYPYSCCEMGGGMQVWYPYRFVVDPASVEAMAVVKTAGGCNFLGYYMYRGGTNPTGEVNPFLNEHTCPRFNYDFQAPVGEWGQARRHFHLLRLVHLALWSNQDWVVPLPTVLPEGAEDLDPKDNQAVRWSLRTDGRRGLLCVTNYQDHWARSDLADLSWTFTTPGGEVRFPWEGSVGLGAGESCLLPFGMPWGSMTIRSATAQPVTSVTADGRRLWLFAAPAGMEPVFRVAGTAEGEVTLRPALNRPLEVRAADGSVEVLLVVPKVEAEQYQVVESRGARRLVRTQALVLPGLPGEPGFRLEAEGDGPWTLECFGGLQTSQAQGGLLVATGHRDGWAQYRVDLTPRPAAGREWRLTPAGPHKAVVELEPQALVGAVHLLARVDYEGDQAMAFQDGKMFGDHFAHGAPWDLSLSTPAVDPARPVVLSLTPLKTGARVVHDTAMAGRLETGATIGGFRSVTAVPLRRVSLGG